MTELYDKKYRYIPLTDFPVLPRLDNSIRAFIWINL